MAPMPQHPATDSRVGQDAFTAAAHSGLQRQQQGRWGLHMAARMSRSLAETDSSGTLA